MSDHRDQIARLRKELQITAAAPMPLPELVALIDADLDRMEARYTSVVDNVAFSSTHAQHRREVSITKSIGLGDRDTAAFVLGAILHHHRDAIRDDIMQLVVEAVTPPRMTESDRLAKYEKLSRELYRLELADEQRVEAGEVARRPDVDPRAALGLPEEIAFNPAVVKTLEVLWQP